jgi:cysteinyl-tRNA synthetase
MPHLIVKTKKHPYNIRMNEKISIYNTLSRTKEVFSPLTPGKVTIYSCGPTVYDTPHIGNYRSFIMSDLVRRMFEFNNYNVEHVMNITDVDDKTIRKSLAEKQPLKVITQKYEKEFLEDFRWLNISLPQHIVRATENIPSMIELVSDLLDTGVAYKADDGIYMSIEKVKDYGALAHLDLSHTAHERIANDEYDKDNPRDFVIWKFRTPEDGDVFWSAPFGEGRPGWHIECSAMAMKILGSTIDIHTGGSDLIFPHHTNEIAQSESATGKQFVRFWMHGGFMNVNDEKMAKSKGTGLKLADLQAEDIVPIAYRYWLMTSHYRSPINFSYDALQGAQSALIRLFSTFSKYPDGGNTAPSYQEKFQAFINDDLDTPQAIALMWELTKDSDVSEADKKATLLNFDRIFGLRLDLLPEYTDETPTELPPEIQALAEAREEARREKDWVKADALRAEIEARGFEVKDTKTGIRLMPM